MHKTNPDLFTVYTQGGHQTDVASIVDAMSSKQVHQTCCNLGTFSKRLALVFDIWSTMQ